MNCKMDLVGKEVAVDSKPINILTGMDYWLVNLMYKVPKVVMCYHLDGIVQKYELVKTEDLPSIDGSRSFLLKL